MCMLMLNLANVSNNELSKCTSNLCKPKASTAGCSKHFSSTVFSTLQPVWCHREGRSLIWSSQAHTFGCEHESTTHLCLQGHLSWAQVLTAMMQWHFLCVSSAVCVQRVSSHTHKDAIMHASAAVNSSSRKELLLKLNSAHSNQPDHKVGGRDLRGTGALMWLVKSSVTVYCVKPRYTVAAAEVYNSENNVCELSTVLFPYYH